MLYPLLMQITLTPIATVTNVRNEIKDDFWGSVVSEITLASHIPTESFDNIEACSHLEIIYYFNQVHDEDVMYYGYPRGNTNYPLTGIFAQRKKDRPNKIGLCTVELITRNGRSITVKHLDAINGTPVLDIKPVFKEFQPKTPVRQPDWVEGMMKDYWKE